MEYSSNMENFACCFLFEEDGDCLSDPVVEEEIRQGLWALKPFKALGVDGLHAGFFQYFWEDVKHSVCNEVISIFDMRRVPEYLNETLITLIPKCPNLKSFSNYRPISLCNTIYKVVTKIIVGRIRPFLDKLVSPNQVTFMPGRRGLDNVVIAQELIHMLDNKKGKVGFMAIKIGLVKAYDRLEWLFIRKVLRAFHFPHVFTDLIMSCVSSTSTSILFNGGKLETFMPSRGIRQGDLLSPYLFILCMEYLGFLINKSCMEKKWTPLKTSKDNVEISHLFFANNLLLFAKANLAGAKAIKEVLEKFCEESGQLVNLDKSRIYFSPNSQDGVKENISVILNIQATSCLGKYLGFPLRHKGVGRSQYNFITEKIISKLSEWKAKFLSFAGRTVLVKSVMTAIPNYVMQGATLPIHLCEKIDKINKDFLWGSTMEKKKLHLVGWNKIIKSKDEGGLGIQATRARNIALLAKLNWWLYQEKDALWAKVVLNKYCSQSRRRSKDPDKLTCSPIWTTIKAGFNVFEKGVCWYVGTNSKLNFWESKWVKGGTVWELIEGPLMRHEADFTIADMFQVGR